MAAFMPVALDDTCKCSRFVVGRMRIVILTTMTTITITTNRNDVVAGCLAARCLICCLYVHIYIFFKIYIFSICCYSYCRRCCYCCYHSCCNRKHFTKEFTFLGGITLMEFLQNIKIFQAKGTNRREVQALENKTERRHKQ